MILFPAIRWSPLRLTVAFLGGYAGLLGMQHGSFALLQGATMPAGMAFNAIGPPCQPEMVWHACFPAMTLIPNLRVTGIAAIIVGFLLLVWALRFVQRRHGGWMLGLFAVLLLLVGGGFVPVFIGLVAAAASHGLQRPVAGSRFAAVARAWPWPLVVMALWLPGSWLLGHFFGPLMLDVAQPMLWPDACRYRDRHLFRCGLLLGASCGSDVPLSEYAGLRALEYLAGTCVIPPVEGNMM